MKTPSRNEKWRCHRALLAGVGLLAPLATVAAAPTAEPAYVSLKQDEAVLALPAETVWAGGPTMLYDAVTPDGKLLVVTSPSTQQLFVFDTASGKQRAVVKVGKASKGVKITPDGKFAYVSNEAEASISVVDLEGHKVVDTIKTKEKPHNVRFSNDGKTAYVTLQGGAGLGVIDTTTRKLVRVIPLPGLNGPHNLDLSPDGKTAFVRDTANHVAVVDLPGGKIRKLIEVGIGHAGIDVTPDGRYVFTGAIGDQVVTVIDARRLEVVKKIPVGAGPHGVRASRDGKQVYVAVAQANKVAVIDTDRLEVVKEYPTGKFPFWVAVRGNN